MQYTQQQRLAPEVADESALYSPIAPTLIRHWFRSADIRDQVVRNLLRSKLLHVISQKSLLLSWQKSFILTKNSSLSLTSPSFRPFGFFPTHPNPPNGWVCTVSSAVAHMVKQFVRLTAIQYGLTFCLYVRSLYEAPLHSPSRLSIRQLDL